MYSLCFGPLFTLNALLAMQKKIPSLRHAFGEEQWKAVAKIVIFGWKTVNYFACFHAV